MVGIWFGNIQFITDQNNVEYRSLKVNDLFLILLVYIVYITHALIIAIHLALYIKGVHFFRISNKKWVTRKAEYSITRSPVARKAEYPKKRNPC